MSSTTARIVMISLINSANGSTLNVCQVLLTLLVIMGQLNPAFVLMAESPGGDTRGGDTPGGRPASPARDGTASGGCPTICACDVSLSSLRCDSANLTRLPAYGQLRYEIEILNLSFNRISALYTSSFIGLGNLRILHLEFNQIDRIEPSSFQYLRNLRQLYLQQNRLQHLHPLTFKGLGRLGALNLSHNSMTGIPLGLLAHTPQLNTLDLSENRLSYLHNASAFANMTNLVTLNLSKNRLASIYAEVLSKLTSLKNLYLRDLDMREIDSSLLLPLTDLTVVDLSYASIQTIHNPWGLERLKQLRRLDLSGISFFCDCNTIDLMEWMSISPNVQTGLAANTITCRLRHNLAGLAIRYVKVTDLSCKHNHIYVDLVDEDAELDSRIPYDPMLGWYTAGTLTALLGGFLVCVLLDRLKIKLLLWRYSKKKRQRQKQRQREEEDLSTPLQAHGKRKSKGRRLHEDAPESDTSDNGDDELGESYVSQNDSTVNPDDQPIMHMLHEDSGHCDAGARREGWPRVSPGIMRAPKTGAGRPEKARRASRIKSDTNKNYASHPCMTEVVRPDSLPKLGANHAVHGFRSCKAKRMSEGIDKLSLHIIEVHPDCPVHSNKGKHTPRRELIIDSKC